MRYGLARIGPTTRSIGPGPHPSLHSLLLYRTQSHPSSSSPSAALPSLRTHDASSGSIRENSPVRIEVHGEETSPPPLVSQT